jgi:hypothetical protein
MKARRKAAAVPVGPKTLVGSPHAKRQAAVILEVLSGLRGTVEGSAALGVSVSRYYALDTRALQGFLTGLEPRPKGRRLAPADAQARLQVEKRRLEREVVRPSALLRAAQRSLGVPPVSPPKSRGIRIAGKTSRKKTRQTTPRAVRAITVLRKPVEASPPQSTGT